jgi:sigma-B regulation protein RsbQ
MTSRGTTPSTDRVSRHAVTRTGTRTGRSVVLAHGFGCDQQMWRLIAPHLEDDFDVICFDHVGAGSSDLSAYDRERYATLDGYAQDVVDLCRELDLHDVALVGHSVSAMIAVLADIADPELFSELVMIGPSAAYVDDPSTGYVGGFSERDIEELLELLDNNYLGWSSAMAPAIAGTPDRPEIGQEVTDSFCRTDPDIARQFARVTFTSDNRADLPHVTARTLVLQSRQDSIAPVEAGTFVHRSIAGSTFELLDATGHMPHLSAPEATGAAIRRFLRA